MDALKKLPAVLLLILFSTSVFAITDAQVFAYAEANYPTLFTGTATNGQYETYNYRYYPESQNYLAVNPSGEIFVLGEFTDNHITSVGMATDYEAAITTWEATATDFSGNWYGSYGGYSLSASIIQTGNSLVIVQTAPGLFDATFTGEKTGNIANIKKQDFAGSIEVILTFSDSATIVAVQNSCISNPGYFCAIPNGIPLTFTR